jgi:agmatine deiminase
MISDPKTNTVYLADNFRKEWPEEFKKFKSLIESHNIPVKIIKQTKDPYCRDYMPVQVSENRYVQFVFNPEAYFEIDWYKYINNPVQLSLFNKFKKPLYSNIILDGGNMVKWDDKVIITDKVILDNAYQFSNSEAIVKKLEEQLQCKVIIIPAYPGDKTGHADGLIRFIDAHTVFINEEDNDTLKWQKELNKVLEEHHLTPVTITCTMDNGHDAADGLYINYMHVGNLVVVPQFNQKKADEQALEIVKKYLGKTNTVEPFNAHVIAEYGGVLNCATWTVKE